MGSRFTEKQIYRAICREDSCTGNMFQRRKEMEELSEALERLINGNDPGIEGLNDDTLPSKVKNQIQRLGDKMRGQEQALQKEREEIRGLIADTAHQLRTPLANMESYLTLLQNGEGNEEDREFCMQAILESEERIRFLTEGFIRMARLENGIIQIRKEQGKLQETILAGILQVRAAAEEKRITVRLEMDEELEVSHDPRWLGEAVYNLLDNSVKYSPEYSEIVVTAEKNEMFVRIEVRDQGIGIDEGEESLVFRRFYRGNRASGSQGFGLGLYLAREIVMRHGGFMKLKRLEPGLSAGIWLPEM